MPGLTQSLLSGLGRNLLALRSGAAGQVSRRPVGSAALAIAAVIAALAGLAMFRAGLSRADRGSAPTHIAIAEPPANGAATPAPSAKAAPATGPDAFIDRFSTIDRQTLWYVHDRGPNGSWTANDFRPSQVGLTSEGVSITLEKSPDGHPTRLTAGEMSTLSSFHYGYFETRLRVPKASGTNTGFYTYVRATAGNAGWNEIDMEFLGRNPKQVELTIHYGEQHAGKIVQLPFDASQGFHVYAFDWQPNAVRWYADNVMVLQVTGEPVAALIYPQNLFANIWSPAGKGLTSWIGPFNTLGGPARATFSCIAYAKVYEGRSLCEAKPGAG